MAVARRNPRPVNKKGPNPLVCSGFVKKFTLIPPITKIIPKTSPKGENEGTQFQEVGQPDRNSAQSPAYAIAPNLPVSICRSPGFAGFHQRHIHQMFTGKPDL
jgi:hypothetical protein